MKALKGILIFLLGTGAGAGSMYLFMRKHEDKAVEKRVNDILGLNTKEAEEPTPAKEEKPVEKPKEEPKDEKPDLTDYTKALKKTNYSKAVTDETVKTMSDDIEEKAEKVVEPKKAAKKTKVPKKITQEEFDATSEEERATLYYYADGILADDEDKQYDPVETLGATNFKSFKSTYDTIYIFNYALNMMFEVMPSNSKYSDAVGGDFHH